MSFLVDPPRPIQVELDGDRPRYLRGEPLEGPLRVVQRWVAEVDWWNRPIAREYWRVVLRERLLCEIFRDLDQDAWFVERVFD